MEKKERKKLVKELALRLKMEKEMEYFNSFEVYKEKTIFNGKYLSKEEETLLEAFKDFLRVNSYLPNEEIVKILHLNKKQFKFLIDCEARYPDFIESVKKHLGELKHRIAYDRRSDEILAKKLP